MQILFDNKKNSQQIVIMVCTVTDLFSYERSGNLGLLTEYGPETLNQKQKLR